MTYYTRPDPSPSMVAVAAAAVSLAAALLGIFSCTTSRHYVEPDPSAWPVGPCPYVEGAVKLEGSPAHAPAVAAAIQELALRWPGPKVFPCPSRRQDVEITVQDTMPPGLAGVTDYFGRIRIAVNARYPTIGRSALTHELVHWALWRSTGNFDEDHEQNAWGRNWTRAHTQAIEDADNALRARGL